MAETLVTLTHIFQILNMSQQSGNPTTSNAQSPVHRNPRMLAFWQHAEEPSRFRKPYLFRRQNFFFSPRNSTFNNTNKNEHRENLSTVHGKVNTPVDLSVPRSHQNSLSNGSKQRGELNNRHFPSRGADRNETCRCAIPFPFSVPRLLSNASPQAC